MLTKGTLMFKLVALFFLTFSMNSFAFLDGCAKDIFKVGASFDSAIFNADRDGDELDLVSDEDLDLIGRHRINMKYEYALNFKLVKKSNVSQRIRVKQTLEAIFGAHPHINPIRTETALTFYPLSTVSALGLSFSYIYGHDNYNYRIVDSGSQFSVGLTWDLFPPVKLKNG